MQNYSNELNCLFEVEEAFRHAAFQWNHLDDESKKRDLTNVFKPCDDTKLYSSGLFDELVFSRLIDEGYLSAQSLLLIPDIAIEVALSYQEEIASWVRRAFCQESVYKKLDRSYIVEQIFAVASHAGDDGFIYRSGWDMLYDMGFKKELLAYGERFAKMLERELDEDDRQDAMDMPDK